ncbi:hypothetical protein WCLP8_570006 [uncultured Gammaproteobacteria bacterium]
MRPLTESRPEKGGQSMLVAARGKVTEADLVRLRAFGISAVLGAESMAALIKQSEVVSLPPCGALFEQRQPADWIYLVLDGLVGLLAPTGSGHCLIDMIGPGQMVGEAGMFDTGFHPVTVQAITAARAVAVPAAAMMVLLEDNPAFRRYLLGYMSGRLRVLVRQIARLKLMTTPQRVGAYLLGLVNRSSGPATLNLACERRMIAGMLGMTPESLSRAFRSLALVGVHSQGKRTVHISSLERLRAFTEALPSAVEPPSPERVKRPSVPPVSSRPMGGVATGLGHWTRCRWVDLGEKRETWADAQAIMPDDLEHISAPAPKHEQITSMRVLSKGFLDLQRQPVHAPAHVGSAYRQPNARTRRNWDHRPTSALTIALARSGDTETGIRTCPPLPAITSIVGSGPEATAGRSADTTTWANPVVALRHSFRHR